MLDGLNRISPLMEKVKNSGMDSVAITDHGVMYGVTEFWLKAKDYGIKPIIGCELYLAPEKRGLKTDVNGIKYYHLLALAKNRVGYENLNKLVSISHLEGLYYKPRVDKETLAKYSEGLILTSACLAGPLCRHHLRGENEKVEEWLQFFKTTFKDDFYLEIQRNGFQNTDIWEESMAEGKTAGEVKTIKEQMSANVMLQELGQKHKIPVITTTDAHFLNQNDKDTQEILFAIKDGRLLIDPKRRAGYLDTYVKTPQEIKAHFEDRPEIIDNTLELNSKIEAYDIRYDRIQPKYYLNTSKSSEQELRQQVFDGAKVMYGQVTDSLKERLEYELKVIHDKGYDDYFLVVSDIIKWARSQGIVVGVRGSVAGSAVAYCLDIINVEPLSWELYFERFLNPERPSPPDIDMDFQDDRRDEVIRYVEERYGHDNVAAICAIGRMKTKAAIRDVARVMGIDLKIADKLSKMVHVIFGKVKPIAKMMDEDPEFAAIINSSAELQRLKDTVEKIEGMARHVSTHACGHLITPEPIMNYVSVQYETGKDKGKVLTQQEGVWLEELGLMKFDFLGLRNLTIIKNTIDLIERYHGVKIETKKIPLDDKKTFELFSRGETTGVFQFESPPMQKYLKDLQPETLEDLCFMVSAYRPGPMKYIPEYILCRHGKKQPTYLIPEMEPILQKTYGFAIYQEQVIKIAVDVAGYSMGSADLLRRAMGKKKHDIMKKEEVIFKKGVMDKGYDESIAQQIWEYLLPFADYGFNKAHGASYALIAYWCAYLKANYPIEFMTGLMHSDISDSERVAIDMAEARKMNFAILPPDINKSDVNFTIENGQYIRFGLGAIKHVGMNLVEQIVAERQKGGKYSNIDDFVCRIAKYRPNKKALECLAKIGAFDQFGWRNQMIAVLPQVLEKAQNMEKSRSIGQVDLFGGGTVDSAPTIEKTSLPDLDDIDDSQKITWEKELIGSYITAHPLDKYRQITLNPDIHSLGEFTGKEHLNQTIFKQGETYKFLALITGIKHLLTKNGSKPMAILQIEDQFAKIEAVVFPRDYEKLKEKIIDGAIYVFFGNVSENNDRLNIIVNDLYSADEVETTDEIKIDIRKTASKEELMNIKKIITMYRDGPIKLEVTYGSNMTPNKFETTVKYAPELVEKLRPFIIN